MGIFATFNAWEKCRQAAGARRKSSNAEEYISVADGTRNPPEAIGFLYSSDLFGSAGLYHIYLGENGVISVAYMIERTF